MHTSRGRDEGTDQVDGVLSSHGEGNRDISIEDQVDGLAVVAVQLQGSNGEGLAGLGVALLILVLIGGRDQGPSLVLSSCREDGLQ